MQTVTIIQRRLTHYRVPLFEQLALRLAEADIRLQLLHGDPTESEAKKNDSGSLPWAQHLPTRYLLDGRVCWQPFLQQAAGSALVIVTQENKQVNNLLALASPRRPAMAFWGHGRNMQARAPDGAFERFKRWTTCRVDWWFAYTELSARFVRDDGFPPDRITVLNNSIDTEELRAAVTQARRQTRAALRASLGLGEGPLGLFMGSLYEDKRIGFLIEAARAIHSHVPSFELVLAGDGPQRPLVEAACREHPFLHYLGSVRGARKAELLAASDLMLNPGLVGLGILDAFVAGLPMVTTDCHLHSPEIAYLDSGRNGLMTADSVPAFVDAAVGLCSDEARRQALAEGAERAGADYSIQRMAERFTAGIVAALAAGRQRRHS